ncbi:glycosyltransferase [Salicibibacter halophilus]|uniref:4,4'-diaponeurosporenoate glycosyltransferase n=1 Tax=Salicibibacter halophilus TaxID=2502791 RepID=A0A514LE67_9BACI|nr:glycosyltransferase family 2 protein [Salicibibacter halophilus]QDI90143.1 glycosyltransferase [Salicibibacter halophilus]
MLTWLMIVSAFIVVLALASGCFMFWKVPHVKHQTDKAMTDAFISIVVPARNEEARLEPLLDSIAKQDWRQCEVIVVDDDSTDHTVSIANDYGGHVIHNRELKEGWIGKTAACWKGATAANGDYFLFLDADTRFQNRKSLTRLISAYQEVGAQGILSVQPYHTIERAYENLSAVFNVIVMAGMNVFTPLGEKIKSAGSFGPCILCSKDDYFSSGGHEQARGAVMDDFALGEAMRNIGLPVRCYGGRGLINFRMYAEGIGQLVEGWTKNFATASQSTHPLVMTLIIIWISGGFVTVPLLVSAALIGSVFWGVIGSIAYLSYMAQLFVLARRTGNFHFWAFIVYPMLLVFFTILYIWSLFLTNVLHTVRWRGRKIKV